MMIRAFLLVLIAASPALCQPATAIEKPGQPSPHAVVITIHGFCPESARQSSTCTTDVTREQFERMLAALNVSPQFASNQIAMRNFAENYVQLLELSAAAEKSGLDKSPEVQELLSLVRMRALADVFRQQLQQSANPSQQEIEQYYQQNQSRFEQVELDRIAVPRRSPVLNQEAEIQFDHKAEQLAQNIRQRMLKGEEPSRLQAEAYKTLGLTPPLTTDLGVKRRGSLPSAVEQEIFSMKAGDVTQVHTDPANYTIFKVRSRSTVPLESAKPEIAAAIRQKKVDEGMKQVSGQFRAEFDPQYFGSPAGSSRPPLPSPAVAPH